MRFAALVVAIGSLAGCDLVLGLAQVTHDAGTGDTGRDPDAPPPPASCRAIHTATPAAPSGMYMIDPDGPGGADPLSVTCDMTTDGGGWTIVFVASSTNFTAAPSAYTVSVPQLLTAAQSALIAFRDASGKALTGAARFAMPADWKTATPFGYPAKDMLLMVSIDGAADVAGTLRYGSQTFGSLCGDAWAANAAWGRLCVVGTMAPFYAGFTNAAADNCSNSSQPYTTTLCAADRQFSIAVR